MVDEFTKEHEATIVAGWNLFTRNKARKIFEKTTRDSLYYAKRFYERRECEIDEIPEIALIGD